MTCSFLFALMFSKLCYTALKSTDLIRCTLQLPLHSPVLAPICFSELKLSSHYKLHMYSERREHGTKRNLHQFRVWSITEPKFVMLLIILLGVITKLAMVSGHCDIGPVSNITDWTKVSSSVTLVNIFIVNKRRKCINRKWFSMDNLLMQFTGTWYWTYHAHHKYDDNLDCPTSTFNTKTRTGGRVIGYIYVKTWADYMNFNFLF
jgi:hypothetical protein